MLDTLERLQVALEGRYALERKIGQGGMASVFLARDLKHDRQVAIKVLLPDLAASVGADRFLREIHVASHLQHPNILGLFDSGRTDDGLLYYVMPFIEGESLRDRITREKQLSVPDALRITREVAEALGHAHAQGVIHRDIKPENILLTGDHAVVADFGIARAVTAAGGEKLTQTGMAIGTPHYMSPEQAMGGDDVDGRSDLYSLACVLYEMLAGHPPFQGPNAQAILARHALEQPASLRVVRGTIPEEVEMAIAVALAKVPADRFPTVGQFAEVLGQAELGVSTRWTAPRMTAPRLTGAMTYGALTAREAPPLWRRPAVVAVAAVALLAIGFTGWRLWGGNGSGGLAPAAASGGLDPHRVAVLYFKDEGQADSLAYLAGALTEGLIQELSEVSALSVVSRNGVAPYRTGDVPRDSIARALSAGTLVTGSIEPSGRDRLRVTVRLVDGSGVELVRRSFEGPQADPLVLRDSLLGQVTTFLRAHLGDEVRRRELREGTHNTRAWVLVQQAAGPMQAAESLAVAGNAAGSDREFSRADSLLALAGQLDDTWPEPKIMRGQIAYRRSRLAVDDPFAAGRWIDAGLGHVAQALALAPQHPDGLELRGNLRYWRWLMGLEQDPVAARRLLLDAEQDLEAATRIAPNQAGAWASLSHLYNQTSTGLKVNEAAQRALQADAYLANADVIMSRLFFSAYDLGQFTGAVHACEEGARRFPDNPKFVECQLWLLTTRAREPNLADAWRLADSMVVLTPEGGRAYQQLAGQLMVAAVAARAAQPDSARHLVARSRGNTEIDPTRDLLFISAFVYTLLDDRADAIEALKGYLAANPSRRAAFADDAGWWFRPIERDPEFRRLVGGG